MHISRGRRHDETRYSQNRLHGTAGGVVERLSKLPPFRPACLQLLAVSADGYSAMEDFANIFLADPAMAADLLLVANSMEFGSRCRIETIRHALSYLGLERVRSLASTIALRVEVSQTAHESVRPLWLHSIASAVIAEQLGALHGVPGIYTAALVHDLGRLGLLSVEHERYALVLGTVFEDIDEANRMEEILFGMDHCKTGAFLGEKWGFPIGLQTAMFAHHGSAQMSLPRRIVQLPANWRSRSGFRRCSGATRKPRTSCARKPVFRRTRSATRSPSAWPRWKARPRPRRREGSAEKECSGVPHRGRRDPTCF